MFIYLEVDGKMNVQNHFHFIEKMKHIVTESNYIVAIF